MLVFKDKQTLAASSLDQMLDPDSDKCLKDLDFQDNDFLTCLCLNCNDFEHVHLFNKVSVSKMQPCWNGFMASKDYYLAGFGVMGVYHIAKGKNKLTCTVEVSIDKQSRVVKIAEEPVYENEDGIISFFFKKPVKCRESELVNFKIKDYDENGGSNNLVCETN